MKVSVLVENTAISKAFACEHGLSIHIETAGHKILFDMGTGSIFAENAERFGIDLSLVDIAFLSHGHYDHGGGIGTFLSLNDRAKIYAQPGAFGPHYSLKEGGKIEYIGIEASLKDSGRFIFADEDMVIDNELRIFSRPSGCEMVSAGNSTLLEKEKDAYRADHFDHEQNLLIRDDGITLLIAGCSHRGIINIMEEARNKWGAYPMFVMGGFHLYSPSLKRSENPAVIREIGQYLETTGATFYTGHCTGIEPFRQLKDLLGEKMNYAASGSVLEIV